MQLYSCRHGKSCSEHNIPEARCDTKTLIGIEVMMANVVRLQLGQVRHPWLRVMNKVVSEIITHIAECSTTKDGLCNCKGLKEESKRGIDGAHDENRQHGRHYKAHGVHWKKMMNPV